MKIAWIICLVCALANVYGMTQGAWYSYAAFGFCLALALCNFMYAAILY